MDLRVFISYRREDTAGHAGRLHDALASRDGFAKVFMDVGDIEPGVDFFNAITDAIATCDVMLALVGSRWTTAATSTGARRLDDPDDYVAAEIAAALDRQVRVIPVLIEGARMPTAAELPERIRALERRNGMTLDTVSWARDLEALLAALHHLNPSSADQAPGTQRMAPHDFPRGDIDARHRHGFPLGPSLRWERSNLRWAVAAAAIAIVALTAIELTRDGSGERQTFQPLIVTPQAAPAGSAVEISGEACPALPEGKMQDAVYFGLHDERAGPTGNQNPATGFAFLTPGKPWRGKLDVPDGTLPGRYLVYAGCFAADPKRPDREPERFYKYPQGQFEVTAS